ncbi:MAG: GAF domain-containing sensor histidine kinase [Anaerolineae bacterium]|nr:GAF domain-containing sensor histidine kinase [Anaerolineae bacterium]
MTEPMNPAQDASESVEQQLETLQHQIGRFHTLLQLSQQIAWELDSDRLLRNILSCAVEVMEAKAGSLLLLDPTTDDLVFEVVEGGGGEQLLKTRMPRHQGIAGWVLDHRETMIVNDTQQDEHFNPAIGKRVNFQTTSLITAPMFVFGKTIGVIQIVNKASGEVFDESDKELLGAFAAQSAFAIRNAQLYRALREERDRLLAVEEDVRRRLARDLHDGPTQLVAAIGMNIQFIQQLLHREPEMAETELARVKETADQAMHQLRTMMFDLRPVVLETKGLLPALEVYCGRLNETEHFTVYLAAHENIPRLSKQAESSIFAVIQEAIGNTKKHANADNIWITLRRIADKIDVSVRDDGDGFDVVDIQMHYESLGSLGLINMRERVEMMQGTFYLNSKPGQGTTVEFVISIAANLTPENEGEEETFE